MPHCDVASDDFWANNYLKTGDREVYSRLALHWKWNSQGGGEAWGGVVRYINYGGF